MMILPISRKPGAFRILVAGLAFLIIQVAANVSATEETVVPIATAKAATEKGTAPESAEAKQIRALLKKLGPHAPEGTKLAKDNKAAFELSFQRAAKRIREMKPGGASGEEEIFSLMCIPTAYGWPHSRSFNRDTTYTGVIPIFEAGEYEVTMEIWPESAKAAIVLEIDGEPIGQTMHPNQEVRVKFQAGVRALTVHTDDDVQLHFQKLRVKRVAKGND